ncbi:unnamed protein product [Ophioblennius macclurei]
MFSRSSCLWLLAAFLLCVSAEGRSGTIHELRVALADLAGEGRNYLGRLAGEQTLTSVQKAFTQVLKVVAEGLASGLNVLLQHISNLLEVAGLQVGFQMKKVTSEGVIFVVQWLLVALISYWLISLVTRLLASTLKRIMWLLKVFLAAALFAYILKDYQVGTETMAIRLFFLVCACVLFGVGTPVGSTVANKTTRLEQQVKILEKRLRDIEKCTKKED